MNDHFTLGIDRGPETVGLSTRILRHRSTSLAMRAGRILGRAARVLIFGALVVLEPFVRFALMTLATLGMFVTIVFGFLIGTESLPKWFMLGMSVGCFLLLGAYYAVMKIFGNAGYNGDLR
jgi:hypothetical protein